MLKVSEAARVTGYTAAGLYAAIRRGDLPAKTIDGTIHISKPDVQAYRRRFIELMTAPKKDPNRPLTDEEFLQQLWDNDPDD